MPPKRIFVWSIIILVLVSAFAGISWGKGYAIDAATTSITLSKYSGPPGITIWVNGTGFAASSTVYILWDSNLQATTTTDSSGNFSMQFTIPRATAGAHTITATDTSNSASADFTVVPAIYVTPSQGYVGTTVNIDGDGFSGRTVVFIYWDNTYLGYATTDRYGSFTGFTFSVPASPYGTHLITAVDTDSNRATATFFVLNNLALSRHSGSYGIFVYFQCTGYSANSPISVIWDMGTSYQQTLASGYTDSNGSFSGYFIVPQAPYGTHNVTGIDADAHADTESFSVYPRLYAYPGDGAVGDYFYLIGYGYSANSAVDVYWDNSEYIGSTSTDVNGTFSGYFTIPYTTVGTHVIKAVDSNNVNTTTTYSVNPNIVVHPNHGLAGISAVVNCTGFSANTGIKIYWDSGTPNQILLASGTTDSTGSYNTTITIPSSPNGTHSIVGIDDNNYIAQTNFYLGPTILLNPNYGYVGTNVTIQGYTFSSNANVNIYWDGNYMKSTTTNSTGDFTTYVIVPSSPYGVHEVKAVDSNGNTATAEFKVEASITLSSYHGHVFDNITVHGTGFSANSAAYIYWDSTNTERSMLTDSNGEFTLTFQIPEDVAGYHDIYAKDLNGVQSNDTYFEIMPSIKLVPSEGYVGSDYKVYCYGFAANSILTLLWDNTSQPYNTESDSKGNGIIDAVVPDSTLGIHHIEVYDESLNTATGVYTVVAVDTPTALSPGGYINTTSPTLVWTSVDYAKEYELQYDTNPSFSSPTTISHITDTQYTLTGLSDGTTYYWRVRAVDSAGNYGNFSNVLSFTVDVTPPSSSAFVKNVYVNDPHIDIYFSASDSVSGVKKVALYYSYEGGDYIYYGEINAANGVFDFYASHGDGKYMFYTIAYDNAGNIESPPTTADCWVVLDTSPPHAYIEPLPEYTTNRTFNLTYQAWDNGTGVKYVKIYYSTDDESWIFYGNFTSSPVTFVAPHDGTYYFQVIAVDYAGNVESFGNAEASTTVDTNVPHAQIIVDGTLGMNGWYVSDVIISFTTDSDAKVYYSINNGPWEEYQAEFTLGDGVYNIDYYAKDSAGNVGSTDYALVKVDTHAPMLSIISPANDEVVKGTISIEANSSDDMSSVVVEYRVDNGAWVTMSGNPWSASLDTTTLVDGEHTIIIMSMDEAGNEISASVNVVVDNIPPTLTEVSLPTGIINGTVYIGVKGGDAAGIEEVYYVILSGNTTVKTATLVYNDATGYYEAYLNTKKLADGNYKIIVYGINYAGKESEISSEFTVDNTPPTITYSGSRILHGSTVLKFSVKDSTTQVKEVWISIDGGEWKQVKLVGKEAIYRWNIDVKDNGVHDVKVKAVDSAGNEVIQDYKIYVDVPNLINPIIYIVVLIVLLLIALFLMKRRGKTEAMEAKKESIEEKEEMKTEEEEIMSPGGEEI